MLHFNKHSIPWHICDNYRLGNSRGDKFHDGDGINNSNHLATPTVVTLISLWCLILLFIVAVSQQAL